MRPMHVLVINCGSSSIKAAIVDPGDGGRVAACHVERIGESGVSLWLGDRQLDLAGRLRHDVPAGGLRHAGRGPPR